LKVNRVIDVLLQVHISKEETKFGLDEAELQDVLESPELSQFHGIRIAGLMGMASFSDDANLVRTEFKKLKELYDRFSMASTPTCAFRFLSMGMSGDYKLALEEGSNMVRIGSLLFGNR